MPNNRDEFPYKVYMRLRERAAFICSDPNCRRLTVKPHSDPTKSVVTGKASHIHAAAENGPRYDPNQTPEERASIENAIWLCSVCADPVDKDAQKYPAELLKEWKSEHETWVAADGMVPKLPTLQIKDMPGLSLPLQVGAQITGEDCDRLRERHLLLENVNRVSLFNLSARLRLPERIVSTRPIQIPPGVDVRFRPKLDEWIATARGTGSVQVIGPQRPTSNWILELDQLPARMAIRIAMQTVVGPTRSPLPTIDGEDFGEKDTLHYYVDGKFFFEYRGERTQMPIVVPLRFEPTTRALESLPSQPDIEPYKLIELVY
jgi:hypothetical protein